MFIGILTALDYCLPSALHRGRSDNFNWQENIAQSDYWLTMGSMFASHTLITSGTIIQAQGDVHYHGFRGAFLFKFSRLLNLRIFEIGRKLKNPSRRDGYCRISQLERAFRSPEMSSEHTLGRSYQDYEVD